MYTQYQYEPSSFYTLCSCTLKIFFLVAGIHIGSALQPIGLTGGIACGKSSVASLLLLERPASSSSSQISAGSSSTRTCACNDPNIAVIDVDGIAHGILDADNHAGAYWKIVKEFGSDYDIFEDVDVIGGGAETAEASVRMTDNERSLSSSTANTPICTKNKSNTKRPIDRKKLGQVIFGDATKRRTLNRITHPLITRLMLWEMIKMKVAALSKRAVVVDIPLLFEGRLQQLFGFVVVVACSPENQYSRLRERNPDLSEKECRERIASQIPVSYKVDHADYVLLNDGSGMDQLEKSVHDLAVKLLDAFDFNFEVRICGFVNLIVLILMHFGVFGTSDEHDL